MSNKATVRWNGKVKGHSGVWKNYWAVDVDGRMYQQSTFGGHWELWIPHKEAQSRFYLGPTGYWRKVTGEKVKAKLDNLLREHLHSIKGDA